MLWRRRIEPVLRPLFRAWFRVTRALTLGVRGLVVDAGGRVLLIEHTYIPGWHLPGGGVEVGESAEVALGREMVEEAGVRLARPPRLVSIHDNGAKFRGDHVLLYLCLDWEPCSATSRGEIHQAAWFAPDALPDGTTTQTRAQIAEALRARAAAPPA